MRSLSKKIIAALCASSLLMTAVGCDSGDSSDSESSGNMVENAADNINMGQDALPYGATITQLMPENDKTLPIGIEFDNRFITADEAKALSKYVEAINKCDEELLKEVFYMPSIEAALEQQNQSSIGEYIKNIHKNIKDNYINDDFDFNYVMIDNCYDETYDDSQTGFSDMDAFIESKSGKETVDKITSRKLVEYDIQYSIDSDPGSAFVFSRRTGQDSKMYIYTIDGVCYIL